MIQIATNNEILIDGKSTGLGLTQKSANTIVYTREAIGSKYAEHAMPHARYSTSFAKSNSTVAGFDQLEADVRALIGGRNA